MLLYASLIAILIVMGFPLLAGDNGSVFIERRDNLFITIICITVPLCISLLIFLPHDYKIFPRLVAVGIFCVATMTIYQWRIWGLKILAPLGCIMNLTIALANGARMPVEPRFFDDLNDILSSPLHTVAHAGTNLRFLDDCIMNPLVACNGVASAGDVAIGFGLIIGAVQVVRAAIPSPRTPSA